MEKPEGVSGEGAGAPVADTAATTPPVRIRNGRPEDLRAAAGVFVGAFPDSGRGQLGERACECYLGAALAKGGYRLLVAELSGDIVGFAVLHLEQSSDIGRGWALRAWPGVLRLAVRRPVFVGGRLVRVLNRTVRRRLRRPRPRAAEARARAVESGAYLDILGTSPAARGLGVGTALLRACIEAVGEAGQPALSLSVERSNDTAIRLYRRAGFVERTENTGGKTTVMRYECAAPEPAARRERE